jgi:hypothetical protein
MDWAVRVAAFFEKAQADNRIGPVHISLYLALQLEACKTNFDLIIPVRDVIMLRAKISSPVTYHRALRDLHAYGYIDYRPSFNPGMTRVEMILL